MTAYHLAAFPPILLLIAVPTLWPWALAVAAFVVIAALLESRRRLRREVVALKLALAVEQNHRARKARDAAAAVVSPMLREGKGTRLHAVPAQREPLVVADDRWWDALYDEEGRRR